MKIFSKSRNCPQGWEDLLSARTVLRDGKNSKSRNCPQGWVKNCPQRCILMLLFYV
jgi:hypothetical protein